MDDLRERMLPLALSHEWDALAAMPELASDHPVAQTARGLRKALEADDIDGGLEDLDAAAARGQLDGRIQAALLRALADQEWDLIEREALALIQVPMVDDQQRGAFAAVLEKVAERLQGYRHFDRALPLWTALLTIQPDLGLAWQRRSRIHFHRGDFALALADAEKHLEFEPRNRLAWLGRAAIKAALGDAAGAEADRRTGEPFYDVHTSEAVSAQAAELLAGDRYENLDTRLSFFEQLGLENLDLAVIVLQEQWAYSYFPAEEEGGIDLAYTVGLFYRWGQPELMVHSRGLEDPDVKAAVTELVERAQEGGTLAAGQTLTVAGKTVTLEVPTEADLAARPYGYGMHFYRHFMDRTSVPLLLARFDRV